MSKKPALIAYTVKEREGQKPFWTRIGAAWPHQTGTGLTVQLEFRGGTTIAAPSK